MSERIKRSKLAKGNVEELRKALQQGGNKSQLELLDLDEDDAVYDLYDEEKYEQLVESRRSGVDFVVDDEGHGYYDDGEEHIGVAEEEYDHKKRLKESTEDADNKLAKKAKKIAEAGLNQKNSILSFVKPAASVSQGIRTSKNVANENILDIDSLLHDVQSSSVVSGSNFSRPTNSRHTNHNSSYNRRPITSNQYAPRQQNRHSYDTTPTYENDTNNNHDDNYNQFEDQYNDNDDQPYNSQSQNRSDNHENSVHTPTDKFNSSAVITPGGLSPSDQSAINEPIQKINLSQTTKKLVFVEPPRRSADSTFKPLLRDNTNTLGLSEISDGDPSFGNNLASRNSIGIVDPKYWLLKSTSSTSTTTKLDSNITNKEEDNGLLEKTTTETKSIVEEYVNMFWLDACESNGVIYLFGKIPVNDSNVPTSYVSCCAAVHGGVRNLFALPRITGRVKSDGTPERYGMAEVYQEINKLLVPNIIPRSEGQAFRGKAVKRKYAFEHGDIPREEADYLKIVYLGKHPAPSVQDCQGGKYVEKIFGATSSPLELFLLKRGIMGPCWITIKNPRTISDAVSWCKLEIGIENPKFVTKMTKNESFSSPPLVSMCISMKTVLNPSTHLHEIVALSGLIHTKVDCEKDTEIDPKTMRRFTYIRPLGLTCGNSYPAAFPHDLQNEIKKVGMLQTLPNERALLSVFFARVQQEDPDIFASHNLFGFEFDVLLSRAIVNKVTEWSRVGRLRRTKPPKNIMDKDITSGRILCDTYKAAKEFLRETSYSLTSLSQSQLNVDRIEVDPVDVPKYFYNSKDIIKISNHTACDALLVQRLVLKLQIIPLTKQLTNLSGNLWSRTVRGARAERIEYLLLHEFHEKKFIVPEKKSFENGSNSSNKKNKNMQDIDNDGDDEPKVGGMSRNRAKAAYAGGLVLEPKKGLYDTYILLLDFNSLYPSLIQEYNLCFTTIEWTKYVNDEKEKSAHFTSNNPSIIKKEKNTKIKKEKELKVKTSITNSFSGNGEDDDVEEENDNDNNHNEDEDEELITNALPPLPDPNLNQGILPRVIRTLVERRREVKNLFKKERDPATRQSLDIRQKALKLTANSMYGCLGFPFSRFYAKPIAALVTSKGREALQRTVDQAISQFNLDVIYGDTDSVMINTGKTDLEEVKKIGHDVKTAVNKLYKSLELDIDGIFKSMLLLKKKKYAAVTIKEVDGKVTCEKELKGLDLVRRDWCPLSKETGRFVVDQILSGKPRDEIVLKIHEYLTELAKKVRGREIELSQFVITKGLNKNPKDYPDTKGQPHLQVALAMLKANKPVNIGDHIPYVICTQGSENLEATMRAHHPDEIFRSPDVLIVDFEWYLTNQILPPITRLCEPIEGTSVAILSQCLGLDVSKFAKIVNANDGSQDEDWGYTPSCKMDDSERFKDCERLICTCASCHKEVQFSGVNGQDIQNSLGFVCDECGAMFLGRKNPRDCYLYLSNRITLKIRECIKKYYDCWFICEDPTCHHRTMQQTYGMRCVGDCRGKLVQEYTDTQLHTQLKYLESLFDLDRAIAKSGLETNLNAKKSISPDLTEACRLLSAHLGNTVKNSAYNWIRPSIWSTVFGKLSLK